MEENKITQDKIENKKKTNKLLPIVIICGLILTAGFIIFIFNYIKDNASLTSDKAKSILEEKNKIYKKIIKPEPYCGDNASRTSDEINSDEKIVLYWNVSTQFKSYQQLLNFISENITENQIQKLKSNKHYTTFKENLYLEKDNKLYCGVVGAGSIDPNNTTYEIIEYSDNKRLGTATDIYGTGQYKYNITLVKENGLWKIDNYILINSINYDKIYYIGNIIITLKNNFLAIRDTNQNKLIDEEIKISSIDDISTIDYHEYLPTNSSTLKKDKNIIDIYLYCKEDSCDSAFILYQYNVSNKTLSKYNNK